MQFLCKFLQKKTKRKTLSQIWLIPQTAYVTEELNHFQFSSSEQVSHSFLSGAEPQGNS